VQVPSALGSAVGSVPLYGGDAGVQQTVSLARKLVERAVKDPRVNRLAVEIVRHTPDYDDLAKAQAIYQWRLDHFIYVQDPVGPDGPKETLRPIHDLLELRAGDCDDINMVLFPSLLGTLGYSTRVVTVACDPHYPTEFTHVYCEVEIDGEWIPMDAARPNAQFGEAPPYYFRRKEWPITDANQFSLLGRTLGQLTAPDISAIETGAAQIIAAANPSPYSQSYYTNVGLPGLQTAGAPGLVSPGLSYGVSGVVSTTSWLPIILGLGAVFVLLAMGKK
jgi:hypothetical protein